MPGVHPEGDITRPGITSNVGSGLPWEPAGRRPHTAGREIGRRNVAPCNGLGSIRRPRPGRNVTARNLVPALVSAGLAYLLSVGWQLLLERRAPRALKPVASGVTLGVSVFVGGTASGQFPWNDGLMLGALSIGATMGALAADRIIRHP